jgi:hypothetical protein
MSSYMNLLLVAVPLGFAAQLLGWSAGLRFGLVSPGFWSGLRMHSTG